MAKTTKQSRAARWQALSQEVLGALEQAESALEDLVALQEEFETWKDNLPEAFQQTALGEKLETICDLDLSGAMSDLKDLIGVIEEAEATEVPLGFGRD